MLESFTAETVKSLSELIQLSIAPVFLLAGIAGFLNVFTGRLARIIDRLEKINQYKENRKNDMLPQKAKMLQIRQESLIKRMKNTNRAILFMTTTGLLVALVMVTMFLSVLLGFKDSIFISILFIASMFSLIIALLLFSREIINTVSSAEIRTGFIP